MKTARGHVTSHTIEGGYSMHNKLYHLVSKGLHYMKEANSDSTLTEACRKSDDIL